MGDVSHEKVELNKERIAALAENQKEHGDLSQAELDQIAAHLVTLLDPEHPEHQLEAIENSLTRIYDVKQEQLDEVPPLPAMAPMKLKPSKVEISEKWEGGKKERMDVYDDPNFQNWGRTVKEEPSIVCFPKTRKGVQNIVKYAANTNKRVRCSGYKHSWSHVFASKGDVWIGMLSNHLSDFLPSPPPPVLDQYDEATKKWFHEGNELQFIQLINKEEHVVRVGGSTTNEQFRQWAEHYKFMTLPLNVIMVEITLAGSNAPMCHGAGHLHKTLSDLIVAMEVVIADGSIKIFEGPELRALAGALGLAGVVLSLTFKLEAMTYANMTPTKELPAVAVPPPFDLQKDFASSTAGDQRDSFNHDLAVFKERIGDTYYSEFFWFTFHEKFWVNCWKNDGREEDAATYPSPAMVFIEKAQETLLNVANTTVFKALPEIARAKVFAATAMWGLPDGKHEVTHVINGLHFRRGIHNARVRDMEVEIPIGADENGKPDDKVCRLAWWAAINLIEKWRDERHKAPVRCALEMRIMGGSDILLAPEGGNTFTCSIEVLTFINQPEKEEQDWIQFTQELLNIWVDLVPQANIRLHWAKEWEHYNIRGIPIKKYIVENSYKEQIPEFREILEKSSPGCRERFSNELFDEVIFAAGTLPKTLMVRIQGANDLGEKGDMFASVEFRSELKKTGIVKKTSDPSWNSEFTFNVDHVKPTHRLHFSVTHHRFLPDHNLGEFVIALSDLQSVGTHGEKTVNLKEKNSNKDAKGTLTFSWRFS